MNKWIKKKTLTQITCFAFLRHLNNFTMSNVYSFNKWQHSFQREIEKNWKCWVMWCLNLEPTNHYKIHLHNIVLLNVLFCPINMSLCIQLIFYILPWNYHFQKFYSTYNEKPCITLIYLIGILICEDPDSEKQTLMPEISTCFAHVLHVFLGNNGQ